MYLISAYFDDETTFKIQQYINQIAQKTGNTFMLDGCVPPHITLSSFETRQEEQIISLLKQNVKDIRQGKVQWTSVSAFLPYVIFLSPVLNQYLHNLSEQIYSCIRQAEDIRIRPCYQPFSWMPHTTVGKKLSKTEMQAAFQVLQHQFGPFSGYVTKIGLAKTNPYTNLAVFELKEGESQ
mgnify:CR=1 FL=1|jgi:2'-5' RNA ligase